MDYILHAYGPTGAPLPPQRFRTLAGATRYAAKLCPAKPHPAEIGLRFRAEVARDGEICQLSNIDIPPTMTPRQGDEAFMRRERAAIEWFFKFFENPHQLSGIIIQRADAAAEAQADQRAVGNAVDPIPAGYAA